MNKKQKEIYKLQYEAIKDHWKNEISTLEKMGFKVITEELRYEPSYVDLYWENGDFSLGVNLCLDNNEPWVEAYWEGPNVSDETCNEALTEEILEWLQNKMKAKLAEQVYEVRIFGVDEPGWTEEDYKNEIIEALEPYVGSVEVVRKTSV